MIKKRSKIKKLKGDIVAIDTETTGLDPYYSKHKVFMFIWYSNFGEKGFMYSNASGFKEFIRGIFYDKTKKVIAHNMKFDLTMLASDGILDIKKVYLEGARLHCTMLQSILINNLSAHNLGYLTSKYLRLDTAGKNVCLDWIRDNKRKFKKEYGREPNFSDIPKNIIEPYAMNDAEWCIKLHYYFMKPISEMQKLYDREVMMIFATILMEFNGLYVDLKKAKELNSQAAIDLKLLRFLICKESNRQLNINSPKQLTQLLFKEMELYPKERTKKKKAPSTSTSALYKLISKDLFTIFLADDNRKNSIKIFLKGLFAFNKTDRVMGLIIKYRELKKLHGSYYRVIVEQHQKTDDPRIVKLKFFINPFDTRTGRMSSGAKGKNRSINLQSMPKVGGPRQCIIAKPGYVNIHNDYAQIELRLGAHYSKDQKMIDAILNGEDLHTKTAAGVFNVDLEDVIKKQRQVAKTLNFGIWYGMGATSLKEKLFTDAGIDVNFSKAKQFIFNYKKMYPGIKRLMTEADVNVKRNGFIKNEFGRRSFVNVKESYKAVNYLIQGCAADIMKESIARCLDYIITSNLDVTMILSIHDEIIFQIRADQDVYRINQVLVALMVDHPGFTVPLESSSDSYGALTAWSDKSELLKSSIKKRLKRPKRPVLKM